MAERGLARERKALRGQLRLFVPGGEAEYDAATARQQRIGEIDVAVAKLQADTREAAVKEQFRRFDREEVSTSLLCDNL